MGWRSKKVITCALCQQEQYANLDETADIICSTCVLRLCNTPGEKIREAYSQLIEKGNIKRARLLEASIKGGGSDVRSKPIKISRKERKDFSSYERRTSYRRRPFTTS